MRLQGGAGRGISRSALIGIGSVMVAAALVRFVTTSNAPVRGPILAPGADGSGPDRLILDSIPPTNPVRLLFFQGRPAQPTPTGHVVTLDGGGGALQFDAQLRARRVRANIDGRTVASVAGAADGGYWFVTGDGEVLRVDERGDLLANQPGPFFYSLVASDIEGTAWLVRSPEQQGFGPAVGSVPLLARLGPEGEPDYTVGHGVVPADFLLTHLANAGRIAVGDSAIYYAPFIRDEVMALSITTGDTLWVVGRGLPQSTDEPRFEVVDGHALVDYAPVNLGVGLGPDDRLYVLSVPELTATRGRLDVFEPATGRLIRTAALDAPLPTLAVDRDGRVYDLDPFQLLTGVPARDRPLFQAFDLETLDGGRLTSRDIEGRVVLVNFWASWCAPCRDEMPALDTLRRGIDDPDFRFITMNEDVNPANGRAFIDQYGFEFPVLLGRGDLRDRFHYVGLPMTMVVDRDGKIVNRWMGYAGHDQIQMIRAVVLAELQRVPGSHAHPEAGGAPVPEPGHAGHD